MWNCNFHVGKKESDLTVLYMYTMRLRQEKPNSEIGAVNVQRE